MSRLDKMQMNEHVSVDYVGSELPQRKHKHPQITQTWKIASVILLFIIVLYL